MSADEQRPEDEQQDAPEPQEPSEQSDRGDEGVPTASEIEKEILDSPGEEETAPEPGPSGESSTDIGTPAEHESEVVAAPEPSSSGDPDPPPPRDGVKRVLLFLNEVAGGRKLVQASRELSDAGAEYFAIVAPQNQPAVGQVVDTEQLREAAQARIDVTASVLSEFGIEAETAVMDHDPALALDDAVRATDPDYLLLSALYETRFGLTRKDLVEWAKANLDTRVEHIPVRVDDDAVRWDLVHTLVVATKTVNSPDLIAELKRRAADKPHRFTFICPRSGDVEGKQVTDDLAATLAEMYRDDVDSTGQPMSPDPFDAIRNAIEHYRLDEILISTLKGQQSKWLDEGLIDRVREITGMPVEHVESGDGSGSPAAASATAGAAAGGEG